MLGKCDNFKYSEYFWCLCKIIKIYQSFYLLKHLTIFSHNMQTSIYQLHGRKLQALPQAHAKHGNTPIYQAQGKKQVYLFTGSVSIRLEFLKREVTRLDQNVVDMVAEDKQDQDILLPKTNGYLSGLSIGFDITYLDIMSLGITPFIISLLFLGLELTVASPGFFFRGGGEERPGYCKAITRSPRRGSEGRRPPGRQRSFIF